jgi:hypothetical protein
LAARTAIHLCRPEAFDITPAEHPGFAKLIAFFTGTMSVCRLTRRR